MAAKARGGISQYSVEKYGRLIDVNANELRHHMTQISNSDIEVEMCHWLGTASDRQGEQ